MAWATRSAFGKDAQRHLYHPHTHTYPCMFPGRRCRSCSQRRPEGWRVSRRITGEAEGGEVSSLLLLRPSCAAEPRGPGRRRRRRQPGPGPLPALPSPRRPPPPPRGRAGTPPLVGVAPALTVAELEQRGGVVEAAVAGEAVLHPAAALPASPRLSRRPPAACSPTRCGAEAAGAAAASLPASLSCHGNPFTLPRLGRRPLRSAPPPRLGGDPRGGPGRGGRRHGTERPGRRGDAGAAGRAGAASSGQRGHLSSAAPPAPGRLREGRAAGSPCRARGPVAPPVSIGPRRSTDTARPCGGTCPPMARGLTPSTIVGTGGAGAPWMRSRGFAVQLCGRGAPGHRSASSPRLSAPLPRASSRFLHWSNSPPVIAPYALHWFQRRFSWLQDGAVTITL